MDITIINDLRMKIHRGEEPTIDELNAAIEYMIADRAASMQRRTDKANAGAAKKSASPQTKIDLSDLL